MDVITLDDLMGVMTEQDVVDLTDDAGTGTIDEGNLDQAERSAISDLELYASRHYALPLPAVDAVKELVRQLTKCHLHFRRGAYAEEVMELYKQLTKKMQSLTPLSLGIPGVEPEAGAENAGISTSAPAQRFPDDFMNLND